LVNAEGRLAAAKERGWSMGARTKQLLVNAEGRLARARALCQSLGEACGRGGYGGAGRFVRSPFG
jgi:hypothetical protein